jgi:hypothetical protein
LATLYEVKHGSVKPSGYLYFKLLDFLRWQNALTHLRLSGRSGAITRLANSRINPQLLGFIHSDGYIVFRNKTALVGFSNKNESLIARFLELVSETFICNVHLRSDARDGTLTAELPAVVARILYKKFGGKTTETVRAPLLAREEIAPYLRGVFDGDGSIIVYDGNFFLATLRFTTGSGVYAEELRRLLAEIGVFSHVRFCCNDRGHEWWNVEAKRQRDVLTFIEKVGSDHPRKRSIMRKLEPVLKRRLRAFLPAA